MNQTKQIIEINHPFQLILDHGSGFGLLVEYKVQRDFYFLNEEVTIGRSTGVDLEFELPSISKKHAVIKDKIITDCESCNGVYVNSLKITQTKLQDGDVIFIGGVLMYFYGVFIGVDYPCRTHLANVPLKRSFMESEKRSSNLMVMPLEPKEAPSPPSYPSVPWMILVYPMVYILETQKISMFMMSSSLVVCIHLLRLIFKKYQHYRRHQQYLNKYAWYHQRLVDYYPSPKELYDRFLRLEGLLVRSGDVSVRLGLAQGKVILHDFSKHPRLVMVSKKTLVKAIVFQMRVYYPFIQLVFSSLESCFWALDSRLQERETRFYIGMVPEGEMGIEVAEKLCDARAGYDGLVYDSSYLTSQQCVCVDFDDEFDVNYYPRTFRYELADAPDFEICMGLHTHSLASLRSIHHIHEHLYGLMGYEQWLDLKEGHLLVAGMTGSGKSEWLHTFLLSMAIWYDSRVLNFFIIDFKGGGLSQSFATLAHTSATLTNLEPEKIERALKALELECLERQQRFLETGEKNMTLSSYLALGYPPIPHLFIVVDEFAELKQHNPEAMKHLIQIARIGRSLGIHLILSTQQPSGVVDAQIQSNLANIVCLKMASTQDSYELLHSKQAAYLTQAGDFYLKQQGSTELMYGHSPLVSKQEMWLRLYDHELKLLMSLKKSNHHHAFEELVEQINQMSLKASPLYYDAFIEMKGYFAVIDDYMHRQMRGYEPGRLLILGMDDTMAKMVCMKFPQYTLKQLHDSPEQPIIYYDASRKPLYRLLAMFDEILILDDYYLSWISLNRLPFHCDLSKNEAILYLKGETYLCHLQWSF